MRQLQLQEEASKPNIRNMDPSLFHEEAFLKFGMNQEPICCISIHGIDANNVNRVACISDHTEEAMLDTGATRAVTFERKDVVSYHKEGQYP